MISAVVLGFIFFPIKSLREPPQEVAPCFQSHFLISSSESPIIEFSLGLLVVPLGLLAIHLGLPHSRTPSLSWGSWVASGGQSRCISFIRNNLTHITRGPVFICLFSTVLRACSVTQSCLTLRDPMNCSPINNQCKSLGYIAFFFSYKVFKIQYVSHTYKTAQIRLATFQVLSSHID